MVCKKWKRSTKKYGHLPAHVSHPDPWACVQIDLFGPWSFTDVHGRDRSLRAVSVIDIGTRWIELLPFTDKRSETVALTFDQEWLCRYPRPESVIFDNGAEFGSEFIELLSSYGIKAKRTTIKNPQANAIVERSHQVIADSLRIWNWTLVHLMIPVSEAFSALLHGVCEQRSTLPSMLHQAK